MSHRKHCRARGFTLLEVLIAITVLSTGLLALAALVAKTASTADSSRYTSTQSLLASAKLDELNQYLGTDTRIQVVAGTTAGSLTANTTQVVGTDIIPYFDVLQVSSGNGGIVESASDADANGNPIYDTITHTPDGSISPQPVQNASAPAADPTTLTFTRRWMIEKDPVLNGAPAIGTERITVSVSVSTQPPTPPFQMTMVRAYD